MQSTDESDVGAVRLASSDSGDPSGRHLVLVHGFTQSSDSWDAIADELARSLFVTTVDLPGHGRSCEVSASDLETTARLLGNTAGKAIYVGYSLGGRVALTLAIDSPHLVEALVLVSTSPGIADVTKRTERRQRDEQLAERLSPRDGSTPALTTDKFLDEWLTQPLFAHLDGERADRSSRLRNSTHGLAYSLRSAGVGSMRPLHEELGKLAMPVLCLAGENDTAYIEIAQEMTRAIGESAQSCIIPGAGHAVPFEQRATFVHALHEFLASINR